jgi:hypothetical protein
VRQKSARDREIAAVFRNGEAARAFSMKRHDGTAELVDGDYDRVVQRSDRTPAARFRPRLHDRRRPGHEHEG